MAEEEKEKLVAFLEETLLRLQAQLQNDGWNALYADLQAGVLSQPTSIVRLHLTAQIESLVQARETQVTHLQQTIAFIQQHEASTLTFEHIIRLRESLGDSTC